MKRGALAWAAVVVPLWIVLVLCVHWEPIVRDSWGHVHWHRTTSLAQLWEFARGSYLHNNPRLGQVLTLALFTPGPWHVIVTPIAELAVFAWLAALVLGRWPSWRRADDARLYLTIAAIGLATCPVVGPMLCYRPYTGNYFYPLLLIAGVAIPYRFHFEAPRRRAWWVAIPMLVLGAAAGMCNEHVGVAIGVAIGCALVAFVRRGERLAPWMIAGLAGVAVGYVALMCAPGHAFRYGGLAGQQTTLALIGSRGLGGNVGVIVPLFAHLAIAVPWLVVAGVARAHAARSPTQIATARVMLVAALLATFTLLASPLIGERLYVASTMFAAAAIAGWVHARTAGIGARRWSLAVSIVVLAVIGGQMLSTYRVLGPRAAARFAAIAGAPAGSTVVVAPLGFEASHWSEGDDLVDPARRAVVARDFGLARLDLGDGSTHVPTPATTPRAPTRSPM